MAVTGVRVGSSVRSYGAADRVVDLDRHRARPLGDLDRLQRRRQHEQRVERTECADRDRVPVDERGRLVVQRAAQLRVDGRAERGLIRRRRRRRRGHRHAGGFAQQVRDLQLPLIDERLPADHLEGGGRRIDGDAAGNARRGPADRLQRGERRGRERAVERERFTGKHGEIVALETGEAGLRNCQHVPSRGEIGHREITVFVGDGGRSRGAFDRDASSRNRLTVGGLHVPLQGARRIGRERGQAEPKLEKQYENRTVTGGPPAMRPR